MNSVDQADTNFIPGLHPNRGLDIEEATFSSPLGKVKIMVDTDLEKLTNATQELLGQITKLTEKITKDKKIFKSIRNKFINKKINSKDIELKSLEAQLKHLAAIPAKA